MEIPGLRDSLVKILHDYNLQVSWQDKQSTPLKKVTQHYFDRLFFIKLDIPGKPVYLPFDWCLICWDCFTGACVGCVNWGQCQKWKVAKLIGLYGKCMVCHVLCFAFVNVYTYPLPIHCTEILRNKTSCWISNGAILEHLFFDIAPNTCIITLCTVLPGNHNK